MSKNKMLKKDRVMVCGSGELRAVLDYDASVIYSYADPSKVLAVFEPKKGWIVVKTPYYSTGGWGSGSSGDKVGYNLAHNANQLLRSISAKVYSLNIESFVSNKELREHNKKVEKANAQLKKLRAISGELEVRSLPETIKMELDRDGSSGKNIKGVDVFKTIEDLDRGLKIFTERKGKTLKVGETVFKKDSIKKREMTVAFRDAQGKIYLNSQVINPDVFEREFLGSQSYVQAEVRKFANASIPFNVLDAAKLNLEETVILEQGPEATYQIRRDSYSDRTEERHFTGALLLENAGRKFLMDLDRREIEHKIFNVFFVELNADVKTIAEAYDSMKPDEVKQAEKQGLKVLRQGEWFFIPTGKTLEVKESSIYRWEREEMTAQRVVAKAVAHGKGRPNNLYKPEGFGELDSLVCGEVTHQGREHAPLNLGSKKIEGIGPSALAEDIIQYDLFRLVPNTTVGNFTITGDID